LLFAQLGYSVTQEKLDSLISDSFFNSTQISIDVFDLTENEFVYQKNEKLLLHPASNLKILTSSAAFLYLGTDYNFETSFYHTGEIIGSVCYGDLYVKGGFDPEFSLSNLDSVVTLIKSKGINFIQGNLYADISMGDSLYFGKGWMWDDNPYGFNPYLSPLNINHSVVNVISNPGIVGTPAEIKIEPESEYYTFENNSITTNEDTSNLKITRDLSFDKNIILISGDLSYKTKTDTTDINITRPEIFFLTLLKEKLTNNKIYITGKIDTASVPAEAEKILSTKHSIAEVIHEMNKESKNLNAEMILRVLSKEHFEKPVSAEKGIKMIDSLIVKLGFNPMDYRIADGSGLSFYNLITTELLLQDLIFLNKNFPEYYSFLLDTFPIAGIDGTLEKEMGKYPLVGNLRAKTGTLSGISTLTGELSSVENHKILFSIFIQNYTGNSSAVKSYIKSICKILYQTRHLPEK
jgi:D-alanyl-D-alanine carboxypeptidase/D-alanyl-D-alanine-endopeptidase (penicillin-binding protein 4)